MKAIDKIPPQAREIIHEAAKDSRGQPWFVAYQHSTSLRQIAEATFGNIASDESEAEFFFRNLVTALLEAMTVKASPVTDPFQAVLYGFSLEKQFRKAANKYQRSIGGEEAVKRKMQDWINAHPDLAATPRSFAMPGTTVGQVEPRSAEEAVNGLMVDAEKSVQKNDARIWRDEPLVHWRDPRRPASR